MIYRHALVEEYVYIAPNARPPQQPGLLQVNRQVRSETVNIYYQRTRLDGTSETSMPTGTLDGLGHLDINEGQFLCGEIKVNLIGKTSCVGWRLSITGKQ